MIGCDKAHYALLTKDDGTAKPTWGVPVPLPGLMSFNINANASSNTAYYDDGPGETATALGGISLSIEQAFLSQTDRAALLGHTENSDGVLVYGDNDVAPYVAFGFRNLRGDGTYRYVWLLKGKFQEPEDTAETKGESVEFQNMTLEGNFQKINYEVTVGSKKKRPWKMEIIEDPAASTTQGPVLSKWFTAVYLEPTPAG